MRMGNSTYIRRFITAASYKLQLIIAQREAIIRVDFSKIFVFPKIFVGGQINAQFALPFRLAVFPPGDRFAAFRLGDGAPVRLRGKRRADRSGWNHRS
jgi:hypothetical protein